MGHLLVPVKGPISAGPAPRIVPGIVPRVRAGRRRWDEDGPQLGLCWSCVAKAETERMGDGLPADLRA
jgi:hypothetical protein